MSNANSSSQGIDVRRALEILSERSGDDAPSAGEDETAHSKSGCRCVHHASEETRAMGQVIDLGQEGQSISDEQEILKAQQAALAEEREKRRSNVQGKLETMSVHDLVQSVLEAQQQRVLAYRAYNAGLNTVLCSRNLSTYPQVCAEATAHFAVISDTITCIRSCLVSNKNRQDLAELVYNLQQHEKEKLNLSAALHLERIRESQGEEERVLALIRQGIQSLENKIGACIEAVNEDIEELQCVLIDE